MCSVLTRRPHALIASVFSTGEDWGVNGLVKKKLRCEATVLRDRCVAHRESLDPRWIVAYFAVRAQTRKLQIRTREALSERWSLLMWKAILHQPVDPSSAAV